MTDVPRGTSKISDVRLSLLIGIVLGAIIAGGMVGIINVNKRGVSACPRFAAQVGHGEYLGGRWEWYECDPPPLYLRSRSCSGSF